MDDGALYNSMQIDGLHPHPGSEDSMSLLQVRVEKTRKNAPPLGSKPAHAQGQGVKTDGEVAMDVHQQLDQAAHSVKELAQVSRDASNALVKVGDELSDLLDEKGEKEPSVSSAAHARGRVAEKKQGKEQEEEGSAYVQEEHSVLHTMSSFASHLRTAVGEAVGETARRLGVSSGSGGGKSDLHLGNNTHDSHSAEDATNSSDPRALALDHRARAGQEHHKNGSKGHTGNRHDAKVRQPKFNTEEADDYARKIESEWAKVPAPPVAANVASNKHGVAMKGHSEGNKENNPPIDAESVKSHSGDNVSSQLFSKAEQHQDVDEDVVSKLAKNAASPAGGSGEGSKKRHKSVDPMVEPEHVKSSSHNSGAGRSPSQSKQQGDTHHSKLVKTPAKPSGDLDNFEAEVAKSVTHLPPSKGERKKQRDVASPGGHGKKAKLADKLDHFEASLAKSPTKPTASEGTRTKQQDGAQGHAGHSKKASDADAGSVKADSHKGDTSKLFGEEMRADVKDIEAHITSQIEGLPDDVLQSLPADVPAEVLEIIEGESAKHDDAQEKKTAHTKTAHKKTVHPKVFDTDTADDFAERLEKELVQPPVAKEDALTHQQVEADSDPSQHFNSYDDAVQAHTRHGSTARQTKNAEPRASAPMQLFRKEDPENDLDLFKHDWRESDKHQLFSKDRAGVVATGKKAAADLEATFGDGTADLSWMTSGSDGDHFRRGRGQAVLATHVTQKESDRTGSHIEDTSKTSSHSSKAATTHSHATHETHATQKDTSRTGSHAEDTSETSSHSSKSVTTHGHAAHETHATQKDTGRVGSHEEDKSGMSSHSSKAATTHGHAAHETHSTQKDTGRVGSHKEDKSGTSSYSSKAATTHGHAAHESHSTQKDTGRVGSHEKDKSGTSSHSSKAATTHGHAAHEKRAAQKDTSRTGSQKEDKSRSSSHSPKALHGPALCDDARSIDFTATTVTRNNLGRRGPDSDMPEGLVFEEIGEKDGLAVDLVVTASSNYMPNDASKNGIHGAFGVINVQANSGVDLIFRFVDHQSGSPVVMDPFFFTVYDLDQGMAHGSREQVTIRGFADYALSNDTQLETEGLSDTSATFTSSKRGGKLDNPTAPSMLTRLQRERSVTATFAQVSEFSVSLSEDGYADLDQGRNFLFTGPSALVCGQDGRCSNYDCPRGFQRKLDAEFLSCDERPCSPEDRDTCCYEEE